MGVLIRDLHYCKEFRFRASRVLLHHDPLSHYGLFVRSSFQGVLARFVEASQKGSKKGFYCQAYIEG